MIGKDRQKVRLETADGRNFKPEVGNVSKNFHEFRTHFLKRNPLRKILDPTLLPVSNVAHKKLKQEGLGSKITCTHG